MQKMIVERLVHGNTIHPPSWVDMELPDIWTEAQAEAAARQAIAEGGHGVVSKIRVLALMAEVEL